MKREPTSRRRHALEVFGLVIAVIGICTMAVGMAVRSIDGARWVIWASVAALVGGMFVYSAARGGQRPAWSSVGAPAGWAQHGNLRPVHDDPRTAPFSGGRPRRRHIMAGPWRGTTGQWFVLGDVAVTTIRLPVGLPTLQLLPRWSWSEFDVGPGEDLRTESADFAERWRVWSPDLRFAHAVLEPRVMERLLKPDVVGCGLTVVGGELYAWEPLEQVVPSSVRGRLDLLVDVVSLVPPHVWRLYGDPPTAPRGVGADRGPTADVRALVDAHAARPDPGFAVVATRERNLLGRLSLLLFFTVWGIPVGVVLGWRAVLAARQGRANNPRIAMTGLVLNSVALGAGLVGGIAALLLA